MTAPPDQFHRRVRVRLPITDRFLGDEQEAEEAARDLVRCFEQPLLRVSISGPNAPRVPSVPTSLPKPRHCTKGTNEPAPNFPSDVHKSKETSAHPQ